MISGFDGWLVLKYVKIQGQGDQKFVPAVTMGFLEKLSSVSSIASKLHKEIAVPMIAPLPAV